MNNDGIRTLTLREAVEKGEAGNQRNLAKTLNVSMGFVNSIIKRLAKIDYLTSRALSKKS
jgi:Mn-dependent DtxR family transcriptional regulator